MRLSRLALLAGIALAAPTARSAETPAKGKIVAVDLFKNGLAVLTCEVTLGKAGEYLLDSVPAPVHGTFHLDAGAAKIEAAVKVREVTIPADEAGSGNLQEDLAGKHVTLVLKGATPKSVEGVMLKLKPAKGQDAVPQRFLVLQGGRGRVFVDPADVSSVEVTEDKDATVKRKRPQLVLTLADTDKEQTKVTLRYLTHGLSWAPSYRLDISDPKSLTLEQHAVVKNELADLDGAAVRLISGYPNVQYARVRSLLGPHTTLATFFAELNNRYGGFDADVMSNSVAMQQGMGNFRSLVSTALGATPTGEGVDLHYQPIGKRTLADGETLALTVAKGKADYQRIVEWTVADARDQYGRYQDRGGRGSEEDGEAWDALKFKNPLTFPMSTGPATVVANGAFNGQRTSFWVNPGEETVLRVEKALSVRTRAVENEKPSGDRDLVWIGSQQYRKATVEGEVAVSNNRKEAIQMVIRRKFSGDLLRAEGEPKSNLLVEGVHTINKRNELTWTLPLKGGEEKTLKYSYTVLVLN
jgi:hypothetical protein